MSGTTGYEELRAGTVRQVARLMAAAAITAPKSGALVSGATGFVPGLHVALAVCGGAFLLGAMVTAATVDRRRAHRPPPAPDPPAKGRTSATQYATREAGPLAPGGFRCGKN